MAGYLTSNVGLETYCPQLCRRRTIRRTPRLVIRPLFPRYLFCHADLTLFYRSVRYAPDVVDFVHFGESPAVVADALIEELRSWADRAGELINLEQPLHTGDEVEVTDGPMRGLTAVILYASDDRDRVAILLSSLHSGIHLTISRSQLRAVHGE